MPRLNSTERLFLAFVTAVATAALVFVRRQSDVSGDNDDLPPGPYPGDPVVARALSELESWRGLTETDQAAAPMLANYWIAAGLPVQPPTVPWSSAFMSYVAEDALRPSGAHIDYVRAAYADRQKGAPGKYWAYEPSELELRPGDVVVASRSGEKVDWSDVQHQSGFRPTHGNVVVDVKGAVAKVVGGNVGNSVRMTDEPISSDGRPTRPEVFAVLRRGDGSAVA